MEMFLEGTRNFRQQKLLFSYCFQSKFKGKSRNFPLDSLSQPRAQNIDSQKVAAAAAQETRGEEET